MDDITDNHHVHILHGPNWVHASQSSDLSSFFDDLTLQIIKKTIPQKHL